MTSILVFTSSLSKQSVNRKLVKHMIPSLKANGYQVTFIELADYPLPIFSPDIIGDDFPPAAAKLSMLMQAHPLWLISTAEHNYGIPASLKNAIDWVSRTPDNKPNLTAFTDKIVMLASASPSSFAGTRSLRALREILTALGCIVIPTQVSIGSAYNIFDDEGNLTDSLGQKAIDKSIAQLDKFAKSLT